MITPARTAVESPNILRVRNQESSNRHNPIKAEGARADHS